MWQFVKSTYNWNMYMIIGICAWQLNLSQWLSLSVFPNHCTEYSTNFSQVNNNGDITFNGPLSSYTSSAFPLSGVPIIAPYWADVDTRCGGGPVYFRETTDSGIRSKAVSEIPYASTNGFNPTHVTIVTWPGVGYYSCHLDKVSSI